VNASAPCSLSTDALARRLAELSGEERHALVAFLLHLDEFDRRRAWADAGYDSLWSYCLRVLHLREGPAARRIGAMRVLRRFPALAEALRDGRLCLTTVPLLAPLLTEANLPDVLEQAAYRTKAEVEQLVALLRPREGPADGIRRLAVRAVASSSAQDPSGAELGAAVPAEAMPPARVTPTDPASLESTDASVEPASAPAPKPAPTPTVTPSPAPAPAPAPATAAPVRTVTAPSITPLGGETYSLRVTLDASLKAELDELRLVFRSSA
jgi:hypothetical protein